MNADPAVQLVLDRGKEIFGIELSLTLCGDHYATVVQGRLYIWDGARNGFQVLLPVPQADGTVDMTAVGDLITARAGVLHAAQAADAHFRDESVWPAKPLGTGFEAEDLFLRLCQRLGFVSVFEAGPDDRFTIRRGTPEEDVRDKADFILTFPAHDDESEMLVVPLQLTTHHGSGRSAKRALAHAGGVAYVPLDKFLGNGKRARVMMRRAVEGGRYPLWLYGQIIKIACERYLQRPVQLPGEQLFWREFFTMETLAVLLSRMKDEVRLEIDAILSRSGTAARQRRTQAYLFLRQYIEAHGTSYEMDLKKVPVRGW